MDRISTSVELFEEKINKFKGFLDLKQIQVLVSLWGGGLYLKIKQIFI